MQSVIVITCLKQSIGKYVLFYTSQNTLTLLVWFSRQDKNQGSLLLPATTLCLGCSIIINFKIYPSPLSPKVFQDDLLL